jgi:hypothetical protein
MQLDNPMAGRAEIVHGGDKNSRSMVRIREGMRWNPISGYVDVRSCERDGIH